MAFENGSPANCYLHRKPLTAEQKREMEAFYRELPVEALWEWRQELGHEWYETKRRFPGLRPDENHGNHPQEYRMQVIELQIKLMDKILNSR